MKPTRLTTAIVLGIAAFAGVNESEAAPLGSVPGVAYAEANSASGSQYAEILFGSGNVDIAPVSAYFTSGTFAENDFSHEYVVDYPASDLYSIDTSTGSTQLIGPTGISGGTISGIRWDPTSDLTYVMSPSASCGISTLYTIDLSTAATTKLGDSSGTCFVAIAIDPTGALYGFDEISDTLMSIDKSTGATQEVGSGVIPFVRADAMDFNPADGALYLIGEAAGEHNSNIYVFAEGQFTLVGPADFFGPFLFAAAPSESIFFDGFELP